MTPKLRTLVAVLGLVAVLALLVVRAGPRRAPQPAGEPPADVAGDPEARARRLAMALSFPTISVEDGVADSAAFAGFRDFLADSFPEVNRALTLETVGAGTLLYRWDGRDPSADPILLMGHYDVVPVEAGTEDRWTHPPFAGVVADGAVWGRGAMDDKASVLGILEAVRGLVEQGFRPARTIYLSFGHDEEIGGRDGAARVARLLAERGVHLELALDEGMVIAEPFLAGVGKPVALVGIAEKGFVSVELTVELSGGHSSIPPRNTAVGILAAAIARLEGKPMEPSLTGPTQSMLEALAPELPLSRRVLMKNLWLFGPLVRSQLAANPETDAAIRTTTAATWFEGGSNTNMLPAAARAVVNFRIRPGQTVQDVMAHVRTTVADDRVDMQQLASGGDPSPISSTDDVAWTLVEQTIRQVFPDVAVAPFIVLGGTDARHFADVARDVYRFVPLRYRGLREGEGPHGADERITIRDYEGLVHFYSQLVRNGATFGAPGSPAAPTL